MVVWMFPGQGSQKKGMGADLFAEFPEQVKIADDILGYSITDLCLNDAQGNLTNTQYTQPALFVVEALSCLREQQAGQMPKFAIGHSLGEYSALFAAGAFDFATGLRLVQKRGELMAQQTGGGMLAVIGLSSDNIRAELDTAGLDSIDMANFNTPVQTVLSGPSADIEKASAALQEKARLVMPLKVSAAFHSRYMQQAQQEFAKFLQSFSFKPLQTTVIANCDAKPYQDDTIKENLTRQIAQSVHWVDSIRYVKQQGELEFKEVGPGSVLTNMLKQIN